MRLAVNTLLWAVNFTPAQIPLLRTLRDRGFDGVEIPVFDPAAFDAKAIRRALENEGMEFIDAEGGLEVRLRAPHRAK